MVEQPAPPWASPGLQGASAPHLEHLLHWAHCLQGCFSSIAHPPPSCCAVFFFTFPCYHSGATSITSGLELAMFSMGQLLESSHRGCPCSPSAVNNWSQAAIIPPVLFLPFLLCECSKPLVALAGDCGHLSKFQPADHFTLCAVEQTVA